MFAKSGEKNAGSSPSLITTQSHSARALTSSPLSRVSTICNIGRVVGAADVLAVGSGGPTE